MIFKNSLPATLLLASCGLLLAPAARAQEVVLYGKVENVPQNNNRWMLDCAGVDLQSTTINLAQFHRLFVRIRGRLVSPAGVRPMVAVSHISAFAQSLNLGGNRRPGREFEIDIFAGAGARFGVFLAAGTGFVPLGALGTFHLDHTATPIGGGMLGTSGRAQIIVPIPNDPSLVGVEFWSQAALMNPGFAPFLSNVDCKSIRA